jgi:ferredoxin--NADP+ reductase
MTDIGTEKIPLKIAIVGSGPSGFYATEALFKSGLTCQIDMFERLPIPYGLVRSGVAPDHPKLKQAIQVYAKIAETPGFGFFGNVTIGKDIPVATLQSLYHAVIFTCGAESDRKLGITGEDLPGSYTATEFVGWYNGHPDYRKREFDLSHETAVIFGQGNVAADVARILAKTRDELKTTDIAAHALEELADSKIRNIYVIGRRGPAQAKFTSKELKEFGELEDCQAIVDPGELVLNPQSKIELADKANAGNIKVYELFNEFSARSADVTKQRRVYFTFLKSPLEFTGNGRVEKVRLEINSLTGEPFNQSAQSSGQIIELETGIVFRSIGYKGVPIAGLPFDHERGVIPNQSGRVMDGNTLVPNVYVAGWIKRGPSGIIGTNRADSVATVQALLEDVNKLNVATDKSGSRGIISLLEQKAIRYVSFSDWQKIDQSEIERGLLHGKPREKYTYVDEMLGLINASLGNQKI